MTAEDAAGLAAFIEARLADEEATVSYAGPARIAWLTYRRDGYLSYTTVAAGDDNSPWCADGRELPEPAEVRVVWDPARVLREVAAKRAISAVHAAVPLLRFDAASCRQCRLPCPCPTLRNLASIWTDHPDCRDEWKPA